MKVAIYARVSTEDQTTKNQVHALYQFIGQRPDMELVAVFEESASAWDKGKQKELKQLMADAQRGHFDTILVWSLDRLTRGGAHKILNMIHRLKGYGVKVISYQESWTEAPGEIADLLYAITGWVAEMESRRRSERTRAGLERARAQGKLLGRQEGSKDKNPRKTGGYRKRWANEQIAKEME